MKLHDFELSGNAYRVRLLLALLGLDYEAVPVNLMQGEQRQPPFLGLNPRGQVPTLDDGGTVVWDSLAILVYLARKYGGEKWLPLDAEGMAEFRSLSRGMVEVEGRTVFLSSHLRDEMQVLR